MSGPGMELIGEEEKRELLEVIEAGYLFRYGSPDNPAFKAKVYNLEQEVARLVGVRYAVAVNSGTSALLVALSGLGVGPGDEVIVPGYTFIASMSSVIYARAIPILAEIDRTFNLDPADVRRKITPRTKAIMAVHMLGNPARLDELKAIADEHGLLLIEDCAQAFGASYKGRRVGSIGHAGAYSFNIFKTITAGDGGMVVTDDEAAYRRFFGVHDQGHSPLRMGVEIGQRPFVGLDFRMTELTAAVLLAQLRKLEVILSRLRANKRRFKEAIADLPGLEFREITDPEGECATILTVILPSEEIARKIAGELGTKVVADSGWHVYSNMEQILEKRTITPEGCPFTCPYYTSKGGEVKYWKGMLPQTDDLLSRSINISIGVSDPGLGSAFGVTVRDGFDVVDARAEEFRRVAMKYL
ncbi:MAG: DegT/DnrJ/EryC1/StrS family aminotransferase [Anaerolineae bacterium]|nr:DegT/DnrJ/EryC1/StrS family aminotransferase [Anaerolineae bacterium]MDW8099009.1 DegT/DnrJ/EryC1/StrS family aminotransferase [Anaerolineae bacterium]